MIDSAVEDLHELLAIPDLSNEYIWRLLLQKITFHAQSEFSILVRVVKCGPVELVLDQSKGYFEYFDCAKHRQMLRDLMLSKRVVEINKPSICKSKQTLLRYLFLPVTDSLAIITANRLKPYARSIRQKIKPFIGLAALMCKNTTI